MLWARAMVWEHFKRACPCRIVLKTPVKASVLCYTYVYTYIDITLSIFSVDETEFDFGDEPRICYTCTYFSYSVWTQWMDRNVLKDIKRTTSI